MSELGLPDAEDATPSRVGIIRVVGGLVLVGIAIAAVWIFVAWGVSRLGGPVAGGEACEDSSLETLEGLFGVDLPEDTAVVECGYRDSEDWQISATFAIPGEEFALPPIWAESTPDAEGVSRIAEYEAEGGSTTLTLTMYSN
jgi:hypothetical protein